MFMLQKKQKNSSEDRISCHGKAGDLGQAILFKEGSWRIQLTFTLTTTNTKTEGTTE